MAMKKMLAVLLALLMILALFTACNNADPDDGNQADVADTDKEKGEEKKPDTTTPDDGPEEVEMLEIDWFGSQPAMWENTMTEAQHFETWKEFMRVANEEYNLLINWDCVASDAYKTTVNSLVASNSMPECFIAEGTLTNDTYLQMVENGRFAKMDEVLEYSQSAAAYFEPGGPLDYMRAWATLEDGNWYHIKVGNNTARSMDLSNSTYTQRVPVQVHGCYSVNIRKDWLDRLELSLPSTTEEFKEALVAFQQNDMNGNGVKEERFITHLGTTGLGIYEGVAQWFGVPKAGFVENPGTGEIELPQLAEGYKPWLSYMNELYEAGVILNNDGGSAWNYATYCADDSVSAMHIMQDYIWRTQTSDPNSNYRPLPIIQALEGITPRFVAQESVAGGSGFAFSSNANYEAAARFVDFTHGQEFAMIFEHGIEGVAWDWTDDGGIVKHELSKEEQDTYGSARTSYLTTNGLPGVHIDNIWGIKCYAYKDLQEALDNNETYTEQFTTREEWQALNNTTGELPSVEFMQYLAEFGQENFNPTIVYSFKTMPTMDEIDISTLYGTDIDTYLIELTTGVITGIVSVDEVDEKMQFAYDNLHLEEYHQVMQQRYNRFLVAMGFEAVELTVYD